MSLPEPYIADHVVGEALTILKTARANPISLQPTGSVLWKDRAQMYRAFELYNEHAGRGLLTHGCRPCHGKVFNWLLEVALSGVQLQQLSITDYPDLHWIGPDA